MQRSGRPARPRGREPATRPGHSVSSSFLPFDWSLILECEKARPAGDRWLADRCCPCEQKHAADRPDISIIGGFRLHSTVQESVPVMPFRLIGPDGRTYL